MVVGASAFAGDQCRHAFFPVPKAPEAWLTEIPTEADLAQFEGEVATYTQDLSTVELRAEIQVRMDERHIDGRPLPGLTHEDDLADVTALIADFHRKEPHHGASYPNYLGNVGQSANMKRFMVGRKPTDREALVADYTRFTLEKFRLVELMRRLGIPVK
jgi:hypothetical protein